MVRLEGDTAQEVTGATTVQETPGFTVILVALDTTKANGTFVAFSCNESDLEHGDKEPDTPLQER